ncbi:uncharacterized protein EDB91DRAFT_411244 [Suillus paluster]|uniref:uncharacterized protein n=1 Tax=Suillus paluster TaxID=48578 RepID=UPI001B885050|nr:uncharacterized protein EDB91DRAFT_411244 [Suillus paluster]KAG1753670.1 hypothetical protein EDB91DRAFT_411244 [Suillus paluster]
MLLNLIATLFLMLSYAAIVPLQEGTCQYICSPIYPPLPVTTCVVKCPRCSVPACYVACVHPAQVSNHTPGSIWIPSSILFMVCQSLLTMMGLHDPELVFETGCREARIAGANEHVHRRESYSTCAQAWNFLWQWPARICNEQCLFDA